MRKAYVVVDGIETSKGKGQSCISNFKINRRNLIFEIYVDYLWGKSIIATGL
jgi:hypothetical protein